VATGALGATVLFAPAADAATFTVTSLADDGANGTLRKEVEDANAQDGDDVIVFQAGLSGTIELAGNDIPIFYDGLRIEGPGASTLTVDANGDSRVFYSGNMDAPDELVFISGLTLTGGDAVAGGGFLGGALYNDSIGGETPDLTIENSVLTGNRADGGGAIWGENANFRFSNTVFSNNVATDFEGGALYLRPEDPGGLVIENSTIAGNSAFLYGGGLFANQANDNITIDRTTFSGNSAGFGGGVYLQGLDVDTTITNSTLSGNTAEDGGGAIWTDPSDDEANLSVRNSTISGNGAEYGGGIFLEDDNGPDAGSISISSSILANNTRDAASSYANADLAQDDASLGTITAGFSLIEAGGGVLDNGTGNVSLVEDPAGSNLLGIDPQLGPLAANGGPTQTHAPAFGSPVIDAGVANGLATDQRGAPRIFDGANIANRAGSDGTDMGSVELLPGGRLALAQCQGQNETLLFAGTAITGTEGNDVIVGTGAADSVNAAGGADLACLGGSGDNLDGGAGKDELRGEDGNDRLNGSGGKDKAVGGAGKDVVKGGNGKDKLKGNAGKDKLKAADGKKDKVNCGGGKDKATVDKKDKVNKNCETVKVSKGGS
jgi:predicted outer membrane repeat protein